MEDYLLIKDKNGIELIIRLQNLDYIHKTVTILTEDELNESDDTNSNRDKVIKIGTIHMVSGVDLQVFTPLSTDLSKTNRDIKKTWANIVKQLKK